MNGQVIAAVPDPQAEALAARHVDLAQPRLGSAVIAASDDFFAPKERLIAPEPPVFIPGKYDDNGKWMDGWESRRKRTPGNDWCILRLGRPGRIRAVDIDTSHFTGNFPPEAAISALRADADPGQDADWRELVGRTALKGNAHHLIDIDSDAVWSHLKLDIFPDGGVARLRVFGEVHIDWANVAPEEIVDLAALENGGRGIAWNDAHFGTVANMLAPGKGANMGDGWETRRRREPGNDWAVIALGTPGIIERAVVDTAFFKGNYPDRFALRGAHIESLDPTAAGDESANWPVLVPEQKLGPDAEHSFESEIAAHGPVSHVRLDIFPDGGISRLRLFGRRA